MALAVWQSTITNEDGDVVPFAKVRIRREDNLAALALLKTDRAGTTNSSNPAVADANGFVRVYMLGGAYHIQPMDAAEVNLGEPHRHVAVGTGGEVDTELGLSGGMLLTFDALTADADPGAGKIRLNHATPASATFAYVDLADVYGTDITAWLESLDDSTSPSDKGRFRLQVAGNPAAWFTFKVTGAVVTASGYRKVPIAIIASSEATLVDGYTLSVFDLPGTAGAAADISYAGGPGLSATTVETALDELATEKADLASPALTGTPTAPTAAPGTNTTQIATMAAIQAAVAALINSAPGALDTLDELAAAFGDDANFAATMTTALAGKQPLDADLTAIAALVTTAYGRGFLDLADAAAAISKIGAIAASLVTTRGDMIRRGASAPERFAKGAANTLLAMDADDPNWSTLTALMDAVFGADRGSLLYRGASAWLALAPATSGFVLTTSGAGADPAWTAPGAGGGGGDVTKEQLAEVHMAQADALNRVHPFLNGFADSFDTTTGVDAANSVNEDLTEAGVVKPTVAAGVDQATTGFAISGGDGGSNPKANAFDNNGSTSWFSSQINAGIVGVSYLGQNFGSGNGKDIRSATIVQGNTTPGTEESNYGLSSIKVQYSDNGSTWTDVPGSPFTITLAATSPGPLRTMGPWASQGSHEYWRVFANSTPAAAGTKTWAVTEVEFLLAPTPNNLDLRLVAHDVNDVPASIDVYALIEETDALTVNTDLKIYGSRTGGAAWVEGSEQKIGQVGSYQLWEAIGIDVSAQSSADDIAARFVSLTNKSFKVHAVAVYGRA